MANRRAVDENFPEKQRELLGDKIKYGEQEEK